MNTLIIKLGALGDVVISTPIIDAIARAHADGTVWLLTSPAYTALFADRPHLRVFGCERRGWRAMLRMIFWIRSQRFDRVFDLQSSERSAVVCALSGIRWRAGGHAHFPYGVHPAEKWRGQYHIFDHQNALLAAAGLPIAEPRPHLAVAAADDAAVHDWLARHTLTTGGFVVIHAGTSRGGEAKRWPHFGDLAAALESRGLRVVWSGGPADIEINATLARRAGIDSLGFFTVPRLVALGRQARFAVSNDSGPMHVLSASGCPVYGLFGPTDWRRNHALGQRERVIASTAPCAGCGTRSRDPERHTCLSGISAATVIDRLERDGLLPPAGELRV